jgi:hypothetical protein
MRTSLANPALSPDVIMQEISPDNPAQSDLKLHRNFDDIGVRSFMLDGAPFCHHSE